MMILDCNIINPSVFYKHFGILLLHCTFYETLSTCLTGLKPKINGVSLSGPMWHIFLPKGTYHHLYKSTTNTNFAHFPEQSAHILLLKIT